MGDRNRMNAAGDDGVAGTSETTVRKVYVPPAIEKSAVFETLALACAYLPQDIRPGCDEVPSAS
jgi:hypothetical protein